MNKEQAKKVSWPDGRPFGIWLSHDVDKVKKTFQGITHFLKEGRFYHIRALFSRKNPYWTFDRLMEIESGLEVRSTLFFLHETKRFNPFAPSSYKKSLGYYDIHLPEVQAVIRQLDSEGWEIGLHGSFDSYRNESLLKNEKEDLENILGKKIVGVRQHFLNLDIPKTWEIHRKLGFSYDGSFGERFDIGYREEKWYPFRPFSDSFLVVPLNIMDGPLFSSSANPDDAYRRALKVMDVAQERGALLSILWHTDRINDNEYPGQVGVYLKLIEEGKRRGAHFCLGRDLMSIIQ